MRNLLLLFMSLFSLTYMYAEENVWVLQTDTQAYGACSMDRRNQSPPRHMERVG